MGDLTAAAAAWFAVLVVMLIAFGVVARRVAVLTARTRSLERAQRQVEAIDRRLGSTVDPLVARLDEVRRRGLDPLEMRDEVTAAGAVLEALAAEAEGLVLPRALAGAATALVHETGRSVRAIDMVVHGIEELSVARGPADFEGQTAVKRGTLNLRHARAAVSRLAVELAAVRPADVAAGRTWPFRVVGHASAGPRPWLDGDADGPF